MTTPKTTPNSCDLINDVKLPDIGDVVSNVPNTINNTLPDVAASLDLHSCLLDTQVQTSITDCGIDINAAADIANVADLCVDLSVG